MKFVPSSLLLAGTVATLYLSACAAERQSASLLQERRHAENLAKAERMGVVVRNVDGQFQFCPSGKSTGSYMKLNDCVHEGTFEDMFSPSPPTFPGTVDSERTYIP
jgi:hypothetical protein